MRRALWWVLVLAGCSDEVPSVADAGPPTWDAVQAIMRRSCVFSSCHGGRMAYPALGADVAYDALVGVASREVPSLRLVVPGDPANSWLMVKMDGTMPARAECRVDALACGVSMPQGVPVLGRGERDLVREWIRLGAQGPRDP